MRNPLLAHTARVDFDRIFARGVQVEPFGQDFHQFADFPVAEKCRRAAAQVDLVHLAIRTKLAADQRDLLRKRREIDRGAIMMARDNFVAGAVVTDGVAKRQMHIQ